MYITLYVTEILRFALNDITILHNNRQELHRLAIQSLHTVRLGGVEIQAVSFVQDDVLTVDVQEQATFHHHIKFLSFMRVEVKRSTFRLPFR